MVFLGVYSRILGLKGGAKIVLDMGLEGGAKTRSRRILAKIGTKVPENFLCLLYLTQYGSIRLLKAYMP